MFDKQVDIASAVGGRAGSSKVVQFGDSSVGLGEVYDAFYNGAVNKALIGYQGLFGVSGAASGAPYSGSASGSFRGSK